MTRIRPLERDDVPAVARLYADVVGWSGADAVAGLTAFFERTLIDAPWADPEIPSLVGDDPRDGVVGVLATHPRRFTMGDRAVRLSCSGPLLVHPDHRSRGLGALLLRAYLAGPQSLSFTDGATDEMRTLWERSGGVTNAAASIGWTRVVGPASFVAGVVARRTGRPSLSSLTALTTIDGALGGRLSPAPPGSAEPLADALLVELVERSGRAHALRPVYDEAYLAWLFAEMQLAPVADRLVRRVVRDAGGRPVGWYVMLVSTRGVAQVMQLGAPGEDLGLVLDHALRHAAHEGAAEVRGRVEPRLLPHLRTRGCILVRADWALLHARDDALLAAAAYGRSLLTRMDGEWWMRPHAVMPPLPAPA